MAISDFDAAWFWPAAKQMVIDAGVEPISNGEPLDEVWPKIRQALRVFGSVVSIQADDSEILRLVATLPAGVPVNALVLDGVPLLLDGGFLILSGT